MGLRAQLHRRGRSPDAHHGDSQHSGPRGVARIRVEEGAQRGIRGECLVRVALPGPGLDGDHLGHERVDLTGCRLVHLVRQLRELLCAPELLAEGLPAAAAEEVGGLAQAAQVDHGRAGGGAHPHELGRPVGGAQGGDERIVRGDAGERQRDTLGGEPVGEVGERSGVRGERPDRLAEGGCAERLEPRAQAAGRGQGEECHRSAVAFHQQPACGRQRVDPGAPPGSGGDRARRVGIQCVDRFGQAESAYESRLRRPIPHEIHPNG